jgi:hypothetical protein
MAYSFSFKQNESDGWEEVDVVDTMHFTGFDFTGPLIGVYAVGRGQINFQGVCID